MSHSEIILPPPILYWLRDITINNPELSEIALIDKAVKRIPDLMEDARYKWSGDYEALRETIKRVICSYRKKPEGLDDKSSEFDPNWLKKIDRSTWKYWPNLVKFLTEYVNPRRSSDSIASLDSCSDDVLSWVGSPSHVGVRKGLILGYVQSGKTQNFTALISKAADCGYKLIIVLSGIDNEIRKQTQLRIKRDILGDGESFSEWGVPTPRPRWEYFTDEDNDFRRPNVSFSNIVAGGQPCCLVVKKHAGILTKVIKWLSDEDLDSNLRDSIPVLIIDDEADQASPNTNDDDLSPTRINSKIREIIELFKNSSRYVAYTATPFANFFINNEAYRAELGKDLFPENFIRALPLPPGYLGTADIYGLPSGILREGLEVKKLGISSPIDDKPDDFGYTDTSNVPTGLRNALISYYISSSIMINAKGESEPCTMLVHVSHLNENQNSNENTVNAALKDFSASLISIIREDKLKEEFRNFYFNSYVNSKIDNFSTDFPTNIDFEILWPVIHKLISDNEVEVRVVNGQRDSAPDFESPNSPDRSIKAILVGGNLLSRGLTIKNLLVSYFIRKSTQADTLLQMARWLGYRKNYSHIMRIFTNPDIEKDMEIISGIEQDIRNQISDMNLQNKTPREFAIFVRTRAGLLPTRKNAMRNVTNQTTRYGFETKLIENKVFPEDEDNFNNFIGRIERNHLYIRDALQNRTRQKIGETNWSRFNIDGVTALNLIKQLEFDSRESYLGTDSTPDKLSLIKYIKEKQESNNELTDWEIIVTSLTNSKIDSVEFMPGLSVLPIERGRERKVDKRTEKIGNLCEGKDEYTASYPEDQSQLEHIKTNGSKIRSQRDPKLGRIFIYPISIYSNNAAYNGQKEGEMLFNPNLYDKFSEKFVMAFAISLPKSKNEILLDEVEYVNSTLK